MQLFYWVKKYFQVNESHNRITPFVPKTEFNFISEAAFYRSVLFIKLPDNKLGLVLPNGKTETYGQSIDIHHVIDGFVSSEYKLAFGFREFFRIG